MQLNLELAPEDGSDVSLDRGLASPMGGKHQRDLSLSAKWANNKALALEYLKRQREAILWIESVLDRKLETRDLFEALKSGIVLRELMVKLYPVPSECRSPISRKYSMRMAPWKERENISIFLKQCKALGMDDLFLFCTDDLYEGTNMVQVLFSVQHFMAFSQEKSSYLFKPIAHENIVFSNQEVEMALSKIEKAGVEANAFLTSAPPSASPSPAKSQLEDDNTPTSDDDLATAASSEQSWHATEEKQELEPAEHGEDEDDDDADEDDEDPEALEDAAALAVLEMELRDGESNNLTEDDGTSSDEQQLTSAALDAEPVDEDAESMLPPLDTEDEDTAVVMAFNEEEVAMESLALAAIEIDQSIMLLEIVDEMLQKIEEELTPEDPTPAINMEEFLTSEDIEVIRIDSSELSGHTDKHETYTGDSLTPTVVDAASAATEAAHPNRFSRAGRAAKKAARAAKKAARKAARESSDEQLDEEAMSRCTCGGSKCSIM